MEGEMNVLKVRELNNGGREMGSRACVKYMNVERSGCRECGDGVGKIQRHSEGVYNDVCGMRRVDGLMKKGE